MDTTGQQIVEALGQYGLAGMLIAAALFGLHHWSNKLYGLLTVTVLPKVWELQEKRIASDHAYRIAYTAKMDSIEERTSEMTSSVMSNTEVLRAQQVEFGRLTDELRNLAATLRNRSTA